MAYSNGPVAAFALFLAGCLAFELRTTTGSESDELPCSVSDEEADDESELGGAGCLDLFFAFLPRAPHSAARVCA